MNECRFEDRIRHAACTGVWTDELRDHCASCEPCAETTLVTAALCEDAEHLVDVAPPLPDPKVLWMRARLEKRQQRSQRAVQGIVWIHRAALFVAVLFGLAIAPQLWNLVANSAGALRQMPLIPKLPLTVVGPGLVLVMSFGVLALMAVWNEVAEER